MAGKREFLYHQLFVGAEPDGRLTVTNRLLIFVIVLAVTTAALSTEPLITGEWHHILLISELVFGAIFLLEYVARIYAAAEVPGPGTDWQKRWHFIRSPLGLIDLLVVVSTLIPFITADAAMLRTVRLLRVFAVMKFGRFSRAIREINSAIGERADDLIVTMALAGVLLLVGSTAMYMTEGHLQPEEFGSIPRALWWAIITLTTVGYGDAAPITPLGKMFASIVALCGIALVAMPTGIIAAAFSDAMQRRRDEKLEELRRHLEEIEEEEEVIEERLAEMSRLGRNRKPLPKKKK
ncbi:MAG: ion transporter [Sphingomonadaceae bacterium]|nr:ion transporter [Sphingomonadaceae bacterium]